MAVTPYKTEEGKKAQVRKMFNSIAPRYDLLNHVLSVGIDVMWRKRAVKILSTIQPKKVLDVATGTGDFAIEISSLKDVKITGIDISEQMLAVGIHKVKQKRLTERIDMVVGDSENLPFSNEEFDAVTVAFGVRNFENLEKGLTEIQRVTRKGGMALVLEFSKPKNFLIKKLYLFYFNSILPFIGKIVSGDNSAYSYLPESVNQFPDDQEFLSILKNCGFTEVSQKRLTGGIATIYIGRK